MVPEPEAARLAPVPTTIAAVVFVLPVMAEKADDPPPPLATCTHVPGEPRTVQIQNDPVWSTIWSPTTHVPDTGEPEAVAPA